MLVRGLLFLVAVALAGLVILLVIRQVDDSRLNAAWRSLERPAVSETFDERVVASLPAPARRYLLHAIRPGSRIATYVWLRMEGSVRPSQGASWARMEAEELVSADGFIWRATIRSRMKMVGYDSYVGREGRKVWRLWGLIPFVNASSPDLTRSARDRLPLELLMLPSALLPRPGIRWEEVDENRARVSVTIDGETLTMTLQIDPEGALRRVRLQRWGNIGTENGGYAEIPFEIEVIEEATLAGYTVPVRFRAGWWAGTDRYADFIRPEIVEAVYR